MQFQVAFQNMQLFQAGLLVASTGSSIFSTYLLQLRQVSLTYWQTQTLFIT